MSRLFLLAWRQLGFYLILIVHGVLFGNLAVRCLNCNCETAFWRRFFFFFFKDCFSLCRAAKTFEGDTNLEIVVLVAYCCVQWPGSKTLRCAVGVKAIFSFLCWYRKFVLLRILGPIHQTWRPKRTKSNLPKGKRFEDFHCCCTSNHGCANLLANFVRMF